MSYEDLLQRLQVPSVPRENMAREPCKLLNQNGNSPISPSSPSSPSSPEKPSSPSANDAHVSAADLIPVDALLADEDAREYFAERAAIMEYDGELDRDEAEHQASSRVFEYRLTGINQWLTLIGQPGDDIAIVKRWLDERYGDRVEAVRRYQYSNSAEARAPEFSDIHPAEIR